ncbi:glycoside hydrolase [Dacryopinax primogenitus]|uniref:Glycoside hydrolase n=1 Tax=Dacryopinax primogenitus (strain DJM 731) TaxID=1858805 RepID=M5GGD2_DACPD|nr:glycoside hydrolase [Dacryopinax primogenitus]EJU05283.1 glycoside hydrolase [Dacryopinax primogenitus]
MHLLPLLPALLLLLPSLAQQALNEPPDNTLYLGAWLDTSSDSPQSFNQRLGQNTPWFQFAQTIPAGNLDEVTGQGGIVNASLVWETGTDAGVYVTVYPTQGFAAIQEQDWAALGVQLQTYVLLGRAVFLRFAPEMNGNWDIWGIQPTAFKLAWSTMYSILKSSCPSCALVWSPNASPGYPYSIPLDSVVSPQDRLALDTDNDGQLTSADDAYAPYYPGNEFVDWAGVSYYYKGIYPNSYNVLPGPGTVEAALTGYAPPELETQDATQYTPFYSTYCTNLPCMFSESGAAWHWNTTSQPASYVEPSHTAVQQAWWSQALTNSTFLSQYPRLKLLMLFEWSKVETDSNISTLRDFRLSNASEVLSAFQEDLAPVLQRYVWASPRGEQGPQGIPQGQVPMPLPSLTRAMPYRQPTPSSPSLFWSAA